MVKELLLARHGEAVAPSFTTDDAQRSLTPGGIQQVERLGRTLAINKQQCDYLVHSPAKRCAHTAAILAQQLTSKSCTAVPSIYQASREDLFREILQFPSEVNRVILVGHNPAITQLAAYLTGAPHLMFSPGMMARIHFTDQEWEDVSKGTGTLEEVLQ